MRKSVAKHSNVRAGGGPLRPESLAHRFRRWFPGVKIVEVSPHEIRIPKTAANLAKLRGRKLWQSGLLGD